MIPFTQYVRPFTQYVRRSPEIEEIAHTFLKEGGKFEAEVLMDGTVSLTAAKVIRNEWQDIAIELVPNGPGVGDAVDRLVRKTEKKA